MKIRNADALVMPEAYDEVKMIRSTRERVGAQAADPGPGEAAQWFGVRLASALRTELPDVDPEVIGRVMLNVGSKIGATLHAGLGEVMAINVLADAALRLIDNEVPSRG